MAKAVPIRQAARELGKSPSTVRAWIAEGAPTERPGESGRGKGALVVVSDLRAWRSGFAPDVGAVTEDREQLAVALLDFLRRDCGAGMPAHRVVGIPERAAAGFLVCLFEYFDVRARREEGSAPPAAITALLTIAGANR